MQKPKKSRTYDQDGRLTTVICVGLFGLSALFMQIAAMIP